MSSTVPAGYTALSGNLHPYARADRDIGRLPASTPLKGASLLLQMTPAQKALAKATLADLEDPSSPSYHQWLTPAEVGARFGASDADLARAKAWLEAQGLTVHGAPSTRSRLFFSGSADQIERAFQTELHRFRIGAKEHFAPASAPLVPADLASLVSGVHGLHDINPSPPRRTAHATGPHARPTAVTPLDDGGTEALLSLAPSDFATIYDVAPLYAEGITGHGQTIAVVGESDYNDDDITQFRAAYGFDTANEPTRVLVPLSGDPAFDYDDTGEAELDLEWSGAVAKDARIKFVYTGNNSAYSWMDAIYYAVEERVAPVISASYVGCETGMVPAEMIWAETLSDSASMMGMTLVEGSGDWGATGCDYDGSETAATNGLVLNWPTSIPSVVSVGGTEFNWGGPFPQPVLTTATITEDPLATYWSCTGAGDSVTGCKPKGYVPETGWNELSYELEFDYWWGAGGGGESVVFPRPIWQQGTGLPGQNRMVPDVALAAAYAQVGYLMYQSWTAADGDSGPQFPGALYPTGGTSAATPSFAGILTLVNETLERANPGVPVGLGNANPVLYALNDATKAGRRPAFHDITTGDNKMPCAPGSIDCPLTSDGSTPTIGYTAGPGYDMVTGLGSVDAHRLAQAWTELQPTSTSLRVQPSGKAEGSRVEVSAQVESTDPADLDGSVIFYLETLDPQGRGDLAESATVPVSVQHGRATASTSVTVPPGLFGKARVVAFYSGDAHNLASWSRARTVAATSSGLAISPSTLTVPPGATFTVAYTGGIAPAQWDIIRDGTCNDTGCTNVEGETDTSLTFIAGPNPGQFVIAVIDADGAEARSVVTVVAPAAP